MSLILELVLSNIDCWMLDPCLLVLSPGPYSLALRIEYVVYLERLFWLCCCFFASNRFVGPLWFLCRCISATLAARLSETFERYVGAAWPFVLWGSALLGSSWTSVTNAPDASGSAARLWVSHTFTELFLLSR